MLLVLLDHVVGKVIGDGQDGGIVFGSETFLESDSDGLGADFFELFAPALLGRHGSCDGKRRLAGILWVRAVDSGWVAQFPEFLQEPLFRIASTSTAFAGSGT